MRIRLCSLLALWLGWCHGLSAEVLYSVTDLGTLGGLGGSAALGINNGGQVVGASTTSSGDTRAFLFTDGYMRNLNGLIDPALGLRLYEALSISNNGQITGNAYTSSDFRPYAFLYRNGQVNTLIAGYGYGVN